MSFKAGDIVRSKIGGPKMIVNSASEGPMVMVNCYWFDKSDVKQTENFSAETLVNAEGGDRPDVEYLGS